MIIVESEKLCIRINFIRIELRLKKIKRVMYKNVKWYKNKMFLRNENSFIFLKDVEFMKKCLFYFEINLLVILIVKICLSVLRNFNYCGNFLIF